MQQSITREEAKDVVLGYALGLKTNDGINTMEELIDKIFNSLELQWIDVKQALPKISNFEETHWVLICDSRGNIFTAKFMQCDEEEPAQWYQFGRDCYSADDVCFWMELPKAPALNP
ncbi:MAG: hypothetical protein RBR02_10960 [Desulfuromonadaceae bacterium]|nr:hypothetical protein [Desulfuromonadaceae bacterium]